MNLYRVINVTPPIEKEDSSKLCSNCKWRLPETCKICRQERLAEKLGDAMLSKLHPDKETYTLMRRG